MKPIDQLRKFVGFDKRHSPDKTHIAYWALSEIERLTTERDTLRTFALHIMESWPEGDVDGGSLQDKALELGLLKQKIPMPRESCGEGCTCAEYFSDAEFRDGQVICYKKTVLLTGETK
jgi:hypothetical protein